jgi:adenylate kinase
MSHIMLVGIQGSGKGTQARKILDMYPDDYILFEMWAELRRYAAADTADGLHVRSFLEKWLKAPTEYIIRLTQEFLAKNTGKTVLIDGAIRSAEQNEAMESVWGDFIVVYLQLAEETAVQRLCGRRIDPVTQETFPASYVGTTNPKTWNILTVRADDTEEAIRKRIAWSIGDTLPLIDTWRSHGHAVHIVDADQPEDDIYSEIERIIRM